MKKSYSQSQKAKMEGNRGSSQRCDLLRKIRGQKIQFQIQKNALKCIHILQSHEINNSNSYNLWFLWIFRFHSSYSTRSEHRTVTDRSHRSVQSPLHESSRKLVRFLLFQLHGWSYLGFKILIWSSKKAPFCRISSEFLKNSHIFCS